MKDILEFPVVGSKYIEDISLLLYLLEEGTVLRLEREPTNEFDINAIKVLMKEEHIGYVPNKGMSCKHCWTPRTLQEASCSSCGAGWDFVINGGLATRLIMTGALEKDYACVVKTVTRGNKFSPVMAKLILE
jgi:hypothetical protein